MGNQNSRDCQRADAVKLNDVRTLTARTNRFFKRFVLIGGHIFFFDHFKPIIHHISVI